MKNNKLLYIFLASVILAGAGCSKSELDVQNPNQPTPGVAATEPGILSLALGAVYQNGFAGISDSRYTGSFLGSNYFFLAPAYHDLMADVVSAEAANNITNQVGVPDYVILDDGTKITNSAPSKTVVRVNNSKTKAGLNMFYFEWTWMYFMNNACNDVLSIVDKTSFSGDSTSKRNALKTWCYFWKGWVYSHIGSIYYAGLIKDDFDKMTNEYKSSADMIAASNACFDKAITAAGAVPNAADFTTVMFDHVGAGRSDLKAYDRRKYSTLSGYADDVVEIGRALSLKDAIFVGHSVSAMIGVLAAIKAPDLFESLVLVGPSARYIDDVDYVGGFSALQIEELLSFLEENHMGWSAQMAPAIMGNPDWPELGEELTNSFCRTDPAIAKEFARVTFLSDNRADLAKV